MVSIFNNNTIWSKGNTNTVYIPCITVVTYVNNDEIVDAKDRKVAAHVQVYTYHMS